MAKKPSGPENCFLLKLLFKRQGNVDISEAEWQSRCERIFRDLKAYLIART
jgi:hypothetical protein